MRKVSKPINEIIIMKRQSDELVNGNIGEICADAQNAVKFKRVFKHVDGNWPSHVYINGNLYLYIHVFMPLLK